MKLMALCPAIMITIAIKSDILITSVSISAIQRRFNQVRVSITNDDRLNARMRLFTPLVANISADKKPNDSSFPF